MAQRASIVAAAPSSTAPANGDPAAALAAAARARPDDFRAQQRLDYALAAAGDYDRVVATWNDYLLRKPNDGPALLARASAYAQLRRLDEARADASRACDLGVSEGCARARQLAPIGR